jgi:hypothetical protein
LLQKLKLRENGKAAPVLPGARQERPHVAKHLVLGRKQLAVHPEAARDEAGGIRIAGVFGDLPGS